MVYGCIVYGSAKKHILKHLDPIHHQGLRIALGAFRTSPVKSLYVEADEPSLEHRRLKLSLNYFLKIKSFPNNPCFDSVSKIPIPPSPEDNNPDSTFGARTGIHARNIINTEFIDDHHVPTPPPWERNRINFNVSLSEFPKENTNTTVFKQEFLNLREKFFSENFCEVYTDGSKRERKVAAAAFSPNYPEDPSVLRLRDGSSVFSAELEGILLALRKIKILSRKNEKFVIFTDSLSAIQAIQNKNFKNNNVKRIYNLVKSITSQVSLFLVWIPAHVGIQGNEKADQLAKSTLEKSENKNHYLCWSDLKPEVNKYINDILQKEWDGDVANKLHEILPIMSDKPSNGVIKLNRKQETTLSRLRIGHTWLTNSYLLKKEDQPFCYACDSLYTVRHILVECSDFLDTRKNFYNISNMYQLFREISPTKIINYIKEIGIYAKI